jgi:hypothetical protein
MKVSSNGWILRHEYSIRRAAKRSSSPARFAYEAEYARRKRIALCLSARGELKGRRAKPTTIADFIFR